ncbi:DNRLRE domain-containing protein [Verrucomicrobiales bacterium]|nr:DNRLRE domain-containing protein [Verrucomicrobiales bacterium]
MLAASLDATVTDGTNSGTDFSDTGTLLARNDPGSVNNRSAALIQFDLPLVYAPDIQFAVLTVSGRTNTEDITAQGHVYGIDDDSWAEAPVTWDNAPNLLKGASAGTLIGDRVIDGQGDSAHILGQLVLDRTRDLVRHINVTDFLQEQSDHKASFLISQDPRWDVAIPSLEVGDPQADGLEIRSTENGSNNFPGPQLRLVRLEDTDGDGISDLAETETFLTDPSIVDTDGDNFSDAEEALFYQTDPNDPNSFFKIDEIEILANGSPVIHWTSVDGLTYEIQRSTDLSPESWESVATIDGTGTDQEFQDTTTGGLTRAFYRMTAQ